MEDLKYSLKVDDVTSGEPEGYELEEEQPFSPRAKIDLNMKALLPKPHFKKR